MKGHWRISDNYSFFLLSNPLREINILKARGPLYILDLRHVIFNFYGQVREMRRGIELKHHSIGEGSGNNSILYTQWSEWSSCSKSCDRGVQFRNRTCASPCSYGDSSHQENRSCNSQDCPGKYRRHDLLTCLPPRVSGIEFLLTVSQPN